MRYLAVFVALVLAAVPGLHAQEDYTLPTYTDAERWTRASTLQLAVLVGQIGAQKAAGLTAAQGGAASATTFGPPNGWNNSNTPMRLFRGMYRNWMSHPEQRCELIEAEESVVRAECNRPYVSYFGDNGVAYGITLEEFEESSVAFAAGIAAAHGMTWDQELQGESLLITIRR